MHMKKVMSAVAISAAMGFMMPAVAEEPPAETVQLKDGSTLYLHPNGTGRMVDRHGKPMNMADGMQMEATDGRIIMMKNKHVWVQYGPPGKGTAIKKID